MEKLTKDDVQKMQWEALEAKIGNWIHFMRIAVRILLKMYSCCVCPFQHQVNNVMLFKQVKLLLAGERKICDQIFDGVNFNKGHCFAELTANSIITLFSFGDAVAKSKRSPEKLFVLLDMYEVMRELQPEVFWKYLIEATAQILHNFLCCCDSKLFDFDDDYKDANTTFA